MRLSYLQNKDYITNSISKELFMVESSYALEINNLFKSYDKPVIENLNLTIKAGEFYALLGPNGAGKTTILRMIAGLLNQDSGEVKIFGYDTKRNPKDAKRIMAWVSDEPMVYERLTPYEYLEFIAGLWQIDETEARKEADKLIQFLDLTESAHTPCGGFSKGMKQKVALAGALIHNPKLIILDEPLTGLDAGSAHKVKDLLKARVSRGVSIIMTTHILEVAERMAERIGVLSHGKLIAEGTLAELREQAGTQKLNLEDIFLSLVDNENNTSHG